MSSAVIDVLQVIGALALGAFGVWELRRDLKRVKAIPARGRSGPSQIPGRSRSARRVNAAIRLRVYFAWALASVPVFLLAAMLVGAPALAFYAVLGFGAAAAAAYLLSSLVQGLLEAIDETTEGDGAAS